MPELCRLVGHSTGVVEDCLLWGKPTHLVTRSVQNEVSCVSSEGNSGQERRSREQLSVPQIVHLIQSCNLRVGFQGLIRSSFTLSGQQRFLEGMFSTSCYIERSVLFGSPFQDCWGGSVGPGRFTLSPSLWPDHLEPKYPTPQEPQWSYNDFIILFLLYWSTRILINKG